VFDGLSNLTCSWRCFKGSPVPWLTLWSLAFYIYSPPLCIFVSIFFPVYKYTRCFQFTRAFQIYKEKIERTNVCLGGLHEEVESVIQPRMTCRQQVRAKLRFWKFKDIITFPAGKLSLATLYSLLLMQELLGNKSKNKLVQINAWLEEYYQGVYMQFYYYYYYLNNARYTHRNTKNYYWYFFS